MNNNCFDIFNYLKPDENDKISILGKHDIEELVYFLNKYYLEYREILGLSTEDTFGLEIECECDKNSDDAIQEIKSLLRIKNWVVCKDNSIEKGCEIDSPVLIDKSTFWKELLEVCCLLKNKDYYIGQRSAGHIHVGAHILGDKSENWLNFIKLWASYEKVIYRFCYGEYLTGRSALGAFAPPLAFWFLKDYKNLKSNKSFTSLEIAKKISYSTKSQAINFLNVSSTKEYNYLNTIEFRFPNGSLNPVIWQNNVNLLIHLIKYSTSSFFNDDIVSKRFEKLNEFKTQLPYYKNIFIEEALELSDLIFNNNLDKVYFLRQYLKFYEIGSTFLEDARPFTKTLK